MKTICICGGGGQCHALAPLFSSKGYTVNILTSKPDIWSKEFNYRLPDGSESKAKLNEISNKPEVVIPKADVVIITVPGFAIREEIENIKPYLKKSTFVGGIFCSNGFFFEALELLPNNPLFGFQRVPVIGYVIEKGHYGHLASFKSSIQLAVEQTSQEDKNDFIAWLGTIFPCPINLQNSYFEVSISNSNPLLHPARLYDLFIDWNRSSTFTHNPLFYEEWTDRASQLLIEMDYELHNLIIALQLTPGCLPDILTYYESHDASSLTKKISSIEAFKGLKSPMVMTDNGLIPNFKSRYFIEDFGCGLKRYVELAHKLNISIPVMDKVYNWGREIANLT